MGAYNLYKNHHDCHNDIMLNQILKRDWKFDGVVISDWGGCHDTEESVTNGLDVEFGSWTDGLTMGATNAYDNYYLADAYKRLMTKRHTHGLSKGASSLPSSGTPPPRRAVSGSR